MLHSLVLHLWIQCHLPKFCSSLEAKTLYHFDDLQLMYSYNEQNPYLVLPLICSALSLNFGGLERDFLLFEENTDEDDNLLDRNMESDLAPPGD